MKLKNWFRNEMEISINYVQNLTDKDLDDFNSAIFHFRLGDKMQAEQYEKANDIIAGTTKKDAIDKLGAHLKKKEGGK